MKQKKAELILVMVTIGWGSSYMFMKLGLESLGSYNLIGLRFGVAFLAVLPILFLQKSKLTRRQVAFGSILGVLLFFLFAFLLEGLKTTTSSNAGFLVGLTVVFVPFLEAIHLRKQPEPMIMTSVGLAVLGIGFLTVQKGMTIHHGDPFCILSALIFAAHIYVTSLAGKNNDTLAIGIIQLGITSFLGFITSFFLEVPSFPKDVMSWVSVLALGLICSAFGFVGQTVAQQYTTPSRTGIIFSLQPIAALFFSILLLKEPFGAKEMIGASFVILSIMMSNSSLIY